MPYRPTWRAEAQVALSLLAALCIGKSLAAEPSAAESSRFDVLEFRVLGNNTLPARDVERAVYPFLGPAKSIAEVESARLALEMAYRSAGYGTVYVDIPEQDVEGGIVRLKVTEGQINRVKVAGANYFSGRSIRSLLPSAVPDAAPNLPVLQGEIAALNTRTPDLSITPVLGAGPRPGTLDLTLNVTDKLPLHGSLEVNNQYTADTSQTRVLASLSYDNLFDHLDSLALQYQTTPEEPGELGVLVASYTRNLQEQGRLAVFFVDSNSDVAALGTLSVLGNGQVYGARWIRPLVNTAAASHTFTLGVDYKDFLEDIRLDADASFQTPISYTNLSLAQSSIWRRPDWLWTLSTTLNFGTRGAGNDAEEFANKGFRTRPNYFYLRAEGGMRWQAMRELGLRLRLTGQYAIEPVISNEQLAIGGGESVRGYLEAEELGDIGLSASLQLESRDWHVAGDLLAFNAFSFLDIARVGAIRPLPGQDRNSDLRSWGVGLNLRVGAHVDGKLAWAYPLLTGSRTAAGDSRLIFNLQTHW